MLKSLVSIALLAMQSPAVAAPEYEGRWVDHCLGGRATCIVEIEKRGKTYQVDWTALDRTGATVLCEFSATMKVGTSDFLERRFENVLTGTIKGTKLRAMVYVDADEALVRTEGAGCSVPGDYVNMGGSYDREYIDY